MKYGQFCPIAKASEVLGERWTLLVLRELASGARRYSELQRGLGRISPSVLASRMKTLTEHGIVERVASTSTSTSGPGAGSRSSAGWEYRLTEAGVELGPILASIGVWGQRWVRSQMTRDELDVELLMLHLQRTFDASAFPKEHAVVAFVFNDLHGASRRWWLLVDDGQTELCSLPPGRPEDVKFTCGLRTLAEVFVGDESIQSALGSQRLVAQGAPRLLRNMQRWLRPSPLANVQRGAPA